MWRVASILLAAAACAPELAGTRCNDGTVCPEGYRCPASPGGACLDPACAEAANGTTCTLDTGEVGECRAGSCVSFCAGHAEGTPCALSASEVGACHGSTCEAAVCGDGRVEGGELCDTTSDRECAASGFHYGRMRCAANCASDLDVRACGRIGWRSLGLAALLPASGAATDVFAYGDRVWVTSTSGILLIDEQAAGTVHGGSWTAITGTSASDVWAVGAGNVAHWDGTRWTDTMIADADLISIYASNGEVFAGGRDLTSAAVWRLDAGSWVRETLPFVGGNVDQLGGTGGHVLASAQGGSLEVGYWSLLAKRELGGTWTEVPSGALQGRRYDSIVARSATDMLLDHVDFFGLGTDQAARFDGLVVTPGGTAGQLALAGDALVAVPSWSPVIVEWNGGERLDIARPAAMPIGGKVARDPVTGRIVIVGIRDAFALEGSGVSMRPMFDQILSGTTEIKVDDMRSTATGLLVLDNSDWMKPGRVFSLHGAFGAGSFVGSELTAGIGYTRLWGSADSDYWALASNRVDHYLNQNHIYTPPDSLTGAGTFTDVAGNGSGDVMVVGNGVAKHWDGAGWTDASTGLGARRLNAVVGHGSGTFVAVGQAGVIVRYDGATWHAMATGTTEDLLGVASIDETSIIAVGNAGTVVRCATACTVEVAAIGPLLSVTATAPDDIIVVGATASAHFDGTAWSPVLFQGNPTRVVARGHAVWLGATGFFDGRLERIVRTSRW